jgi:hypothetical protein
MSPPVAAAVFAIDEKPQIQALNRTAPTLSMLATTPARATHDYQRNGTCDLFAALDIATGTVITERKKSHPSVDFIAFLNKVDHDVPKELKRSAHRNVKDLAADIVDWAAAWNENPRPFVWTKSAEQILERLAGYCAVINAGA